MRPNFKILLLSGSVLILLVAITHVYIALVGGELYIFFGAGEEMYTLDESGSYQPMISTFVLALIFSILGLYGLSGAKIFPRLPFQRIVLFGISIVFLLRGIYVFYEIYAVLHTHNSELIRFIFFSIYALITGILYLSGTLKLRKHEKTN